MELSELQTKILNAPSNKSVVIAAAAAGKTRLMTEKVRQLLRANIDPRKIAVITFTNMAASELRQRLGEDYRDGLFVGTIHALANWMLLSSGIKTGKVLDNEDFDKLFSMVKENPGCIKHMEWILLDEAQDTNKEQFEFIFNMINPECFFVVGDPRQSIYRWRGARPDLLQNLTNQPGIKLFDLNENYRNGFNILSYAKRLINPTGMNDGSITKRRYNGAVTETVFDTNIILNKIQEKQDYGNWAILCRTNKEISDMSIVLSRANIPFDTFCQGDLSKEELCKKMESNTVKLLTVHSAKGLEWPNVVVMGMRYNSVEERCICYVAATRARDNLVWITGRKKAAPKRGPRIKEW